VERRSCIISSPWVERTGLGRSFEAVLRIVFQMRFSGFPAYPNLERSAICQREVDAMRPNALGVDVGKGGMPAWSGYAFTGCAAHVQGTVKHLRWWPEGFDPGAAHQIHAQRLSRRWKFSNGSCLSLGRQPRSLRVLTSSGTRP